MMSPVAREDVALVARTDEVRTLTDALRAAGDSRPAVWLVAGDAGVGKSRLVRELSERARSAGALVLTGQCVDLGGAGLPYLPFAEALGQAAADPATAAAFDGLTALGPLLGRGGTRHDAGDDDRLPLFDAVHTALGTLGAEHGPVLLVIEDLHWADASSRDLLRFVASRLRHERVLVVATYRSDDLHRGHPLRPLLGELPRLPVVERVDLAPFSTDELGRYLGLLRGRAVPRQVVLDMHRRTDGNAYFAEELLAAALTADGGRPDGLAELPWTLTDVLTARLDQLTPGTQQLVRVASVAGRRVTDTLLLQVAALPAPEVEAALREAVAHQVLVPDEREGYRFRHALLREAVYNDLLPGERVRTHARFAAALAESTERGAAAALAHHHLASNDLPGGVRRVAAGGRRGRRAAGAHQTLRRLEQASQLWDAVPSAQELAGDLDDLELRTAATAGRSGAFSRAVALSESARRRAEEEGSPHRLAVAERTLAVHLYNADRDEDAVSHAARAVELLADDPDSAEAIWAAAIWAKTIAWDDPDGRSREIATAALERATRIGMQAAEADLLGTLAVLDWSDGDMDLSHEHLRSRSNRPSSPATGAAPADRLQHRHQPVLRRRPRGGPLRHRPRRRHRPTERPVLERVRHREPHAAGDRPVHHRRLGRLADGGRGRGRAPARPRRQPAGRVRHLRAGRTRAARHGGAGARPARRVAPGRRDRAGLRRLRRRPRHLVRPSHRALALADDAVVSMARQWGGLQPRRHLARRPRHRRLGGPRRAGSARARRRRRRPGRRRRRPAARPGAAHRREGPAALRADRAGGR